VAQRNGTGPVHAVELGRGRHGRTDWVFLRHEPGNRLLPFMTNLVTNLNLTDMETC
jgi:hypothetical protein